MVFDAHRMFFKRGKVPLAAVGYIRGYAEPCFFLKRRVFIVIRCVTAKTSCVVVTAQSEALLDLLESDVLDHGFVPRVAVVAENGSLSLAQVRKGLGVV